MLDQLKQVDNRRLYQQIADQIRSLIQKGNFVAVTALPPGHGTEGGSEAIESYLDTRLVTRKGVSVSCDGTVAGSRKSRGWAWVLTVC